MAAWLGSTRGQADTLYRALEYSTIYDQEVMVVNCDQGFAPGILDRLALAGRNSWLCTALTFPAEPQEAARWSYVNSHPHFQFAAEKQAVGTHALAGAYYFPNSKMLAKNLIRLLNGTTSTEPYISQVYDHFIGNKLSVPIRRKDWYDWGTPEAFTSFLGSR